MNRTGGRPLPSARVSLSSATVYGLGLILAGTLVLALMISLSPAILGLASSLIYLLAYTPLKKQTPLCTTVGALPGAIPSLIGWTAAGGQLTIEAWTLFGILFLWQYPHFLAIAWIHREDYRRGGFKMLPLVDPSGRRTAGQIVLFTVLLGCFSVLALEPGAGRQLVSRGGSGPRGGVFDDHAGPVANSHPGLCPLRHARLGCLSASAAGHAGHRPVVGLR